MKENWDLIEDVWGDADCGDFPDGSGSIPFIDSCNPSESDTKHYYEYNFDDGEVTGRKDGGGSSFFFNFNNYDASEVSDNCTIYRGSRDHVTYSNGEADKTEDL